MSQPIVREPRTVQTTIRIAPAIFNEARVRAKAERRSLASYLTRALEYVMSEPAAFSEWEAAERRGER